MEGIVIGCDEVGYGSLAGNLVVCGVRAAEEWRIDGLNDSKQLTRKQRENMLLPIMQEVQAGRIAYYLASRSPQEIDKQGVAVALKSAYIEIFHQLHQPGCQIIVDGNLKFDKLIPSDYLVRSVVKADTLIPSVMAASIIAKTSRDYDMRQLHWQYPEYDWQSNVGYAAKKHLEAIEKYGPTPLHRMSYAPMKNMKV